MSILEKDLEKLFEFLIQLVFKGINRFVSYFLTKKKSRKLISIPKQIPRQYLQFADGFILVYDPADPSSLDLLAGIKNDIDKNKEKKEVSFFLYKIYFKVESRNLL